MNCVLVGKLNVLQLVFKRSMSLNSVHVDLDVWRYSGVVESCEAIIAMTHDCDTIDVHQSSCYIRSCTERANLETVNILIVLKSCLEEVVIQITAHIHGN